MGSRLRSRSRSNSRRSKLPCRRQQCHERCHLRDIIDHPGRPRDRFLLNYRIVRSSRLDLTSVKHPPTWSVQYSCLIGPGPWWISPSLLLSSSGRPCVLSPPSPPPFSPSSTVSINNGGPHHSERGTREKERKVHTPFCSHGGSGVHAVVCLL